MKSLVSLLWIFALLAGCAWQREPTSRGSLEEAFAAEYHFTPPSSVTELRCKIVNIGDTWSKWMLFSYDASILDRIVRDGFTKATPADIENTGELWRYDLTERNPNEPKWWKSPSDTSHLVVYYKKTHPSDRSGYAYVWIDDASKIVYAKSAAWH